jgi:hypothetical protein
MRISGRDFDTTIDLMRESLERAGVERSDKDELLELMQAQRKHIVDKETGARE